MKPTQADLDKMNAQEDAARYFPETSEVGPFGPALLQLLFMCAEFERRVADLQDAITGKAGFSEQNQWGTRDRPRLMRKLLRKNRERVSVSAEDVERVVNSLRRSIEHCEVRNLLVHGHWWKFDMAAQVITVRRSRARRGEDRHVPITVADIQRATISLGDIESELYNFQKTI
jgi:hypothetical protein